MATAAPAGSKPGTSISPDSKSSTILFNPLAPDFRANPYPYYEQLRTHDPVHRTSFGVWFVSRYDDVRTVLKDSRFQVQDIPSQLRKKNRLLITRRLSPDQPPNIDSLVSNVENWFAFLEGEDHARLRGLFAGALNRNSVEQLRPTVRQLARSLIGQRLPLGCMDVMADFAWLLPLSVIARMLGLPSESHAQLVIWAKTLARVLDPLLSLEELAKLDAASREFQDFLHTLIAKRRQQPEDDLISGLITGTGEQGQQLSEPEIISLCIFLFGTGLETVVNLIGNGTLALLTYHESLGTLSQNLHLLPSAIEELLRFDTPGQITSRSAVTDVELGGKIIRAGEQLYLGLGSANRDPLRFEDPARLLFCRERNHHLAFGDGRHLCVGAQLARIEAQEAFRAILELIPDIQLLESDVRWQERPLFRGLHDLPVTFCRNTQ
jgi:cytochrome P450